MTRLINRASVLALAIGLAACGGGDKPPVSEPPAEPPAPAPETPPAPPEEPAAKAPEPAPKEEVRKQKPAKEILLGQGWDFVLSFNDSDIKAKTEEDCKKKAKDDEAKTKECVSKASGELANERIKFAQDDKGDWWFIALSKGKAADVILTKVKVKLAKDEEKKLVFTPEGKDTGKKPMKKLPPELVLEMPDEYTVVLNHPDRGKLVYQVKVTGESGPKPIEEKTPEKPEKKPAGAKDKKAAPTEKSE